MDHVSYWASYYTALYHELDSYNKAAGKRTDKLCLLTDSGYRLQFEEYG